MDASSGSTELRRSRPNQDGQKPQQASLGFGLQADNPSWGVQNCEKGGAAPSSGLLQNFHRLVGIVQ